MEKEFNATNGVHVKMIVPVELSEAEKQRKIEVLYDVLNTNKPPKIEEIQFMPEILQKSC